MNPVSIKDHHPADRTDVPESVQGVNTTHVSDHLLPPMLTAPEAAHLLRLRAPQVYALARAGILPSVRVGRAVRFDRDRLLKWIGAGGAVAAETSP